MKMELTVDLMLAPALNKLTRLFPISEQQERVVRFLITRYATMNAAWQAMEELESEENASKLMREVGGLLKKLDPYQHPRSTDAQTTSAPVLDDGWENFVSYRSADDQVGAIEHQIYPVPFVNFEFAREDSGAGKSAATDVDTDTFR